MRCNLQKMPKKWQSRINGIVLEYDIIVNYTLPKEIEKKLLCLMSTVGLNTGSIDLIKDKKGRFYFIEVNPVGQYLAPSDRGNYYIEKTIAEWLIKEDRK